MQEASSASLSRMADELHEIIRKFTEIARESPRL